MSPDDIRQDIELKVVELIKDMTAKGLMTEERAQELSQRVLDLLQPGMSMEELYRAIAKLDDAMPELSRVVIPYLREYEEKVTQQAQKSVQDLIKQGQYDAANQVAHQAITQDSKLVWEGRATWQPAPPPPPRLRPNPFKKP